MILNLSLTASPARFLWSGYVLQLLKSGDKDKSCKWAQKNGKKKPVQAASVLALRESSVDQGKRSPSDDVSLWIFHALILTGEVFRNFIINHALSCRPSQLSRFSGQGSDPARLKSLQSDQDTTAALAFFKSAGEIGAAAAGVAVSARDFEGTYGLETGIYLLMPDGRFSRIQ